jgi:hypothetical protein
MVQPPISPAAELYRYALKYETRYLDTGHLFRVSLLPVVDALCQHLFSAHSLCLQA